MPSRMSAAHLARGEIRRAAPRSRCEMRYRRSAGNRGNDRRIAGTVRPRMCNESRRRDSRLPDAFELSKAEITFSRVTINNRMQEIALADQNRLYCGNFSLCCG